GPLRVVIYRFPSLLGKRITQDSCPHPFSLVPSFSVGDDWAAAAPPGAHLRRRRAPTRLFFDVQDQSTRGAAADCFPKL
ncbi:unnamed protein product, partial [Urochloa humidicola]